MEIYLIRHGESTSDIENKYGGDYDDYLTEKGEKQACILADKLRNKKIEKIFTSPRIRTKETAETINKTTMCELIVTDDLRERNRYGKLTGMNKDEAKQKYPEQVRLLEEDFRNSVDDGEQYVDFKKRIERAFDNIVKQEKEVITIVTHGGPIICVMSDILKLADIKNLEDCAMIKLKKEKSEFELLESSGMEV